MTNDHDGTEGANEFSARGADTPDVGTDTGTLARELRTLRKRKGGWVKKPTRIERSRKLHDAIVGLVQELQSAGFASVGSPPGSITMVGPEIEDPKTGRQDGPRAGIAGRLHPAVVGGRQLLSAPAVRSCDGPDLPKAHTGL